MRDGPRSALAGAALARLATGNVPHSVQHGLKTARLNGMRKEDGVGVRVLGCGGVIRRMVDKAVNAELLADYAGHGDPFQFGLQPDGTGRM